MTAIQDIDKGIGDIKLTLDEVISKRAMTEMGTFIAAMIRRRTRNGFGVVRSGAAATRLDRLSDSYREFRKRNADKLHPETSATRFTSNLTFTGQMLDSLRASEVVKTATGAEITISAGRQGRKGGVTNEDIAGFVEAKGFIFLNLSASEIKKLTQFMTTRLSAVIKKNL